MSPQQEEQLVKAKGPETVGAGVMRAPGADVAEYSLTETPEQGNSRLIVPLSDDKQVTLVRTSVRRTDKGVIWRGTVADTTRRRSCSGGRMRDSMVYSATGVAFTPS
jgi:hypothetical protein